ncbi:MAG: sigma-70 family RNA polymerase sigma factor [Actinomycetota bacterium]|nr:sigma-70 family RNA polymerase sigma factor [Actinomycetota bacterium]
MARSPRTDAKFRRIYDGHFVAIRSYCLRRLPTSEVNDAVAEVFLVVWRRIDDVPDGDEAPLWLYGIARNVVRNVDRSARRRDRLSGRLRPFRPPSSPDPETVVIRRSEDDEVLAALAQLRPADQEILRLSIWEELSNTEIAEVLGIEAHAVTMRLSRARNRLAGRLGMDKVRQNTWADPQPVGEGGEQ